MVNGFSKWLGLVLLSVISFQYSAGQNQVKVSALTHDIKDLSQRGSKIYDQNGERCALIKFETPIPTFFSFNLGAQQVEKRENKDDEVWIWVSPDVKKMTIRCSECSPLKDYRVSLKSGNVYRAKITTGLPQEVATTQNINIYCEHIPFYVSIDGSEPKLNSARNFYTSLPIGAHELYVSAKLHKPMTKTIRVYRSRPYMDTIRLEDYSGEVMLNASQSSYSVYVDDELQKQNKRFKVEPGQHKLVVKKDRYETYETTITVVEGVQTPVYVTLKPAFSLYNIIAADDETDIWIDDDFKGRGKANVEIVWGQHVIEGRRAGFDTYEHPIHDFNASSEKTIKLPKLNKQYGALHVSVFPSDATMYIDGQEVTTTNGVLNVARYPTGKHYIQMRKTDYRPLRDTFHVYAGQLTNKDYSLEAFPLGIATIYTDNGVGIYRLDKDLESNGTIPIFLGHTSFTGKLPAGDNTIELRNTENVACQYHLFINDKETHEPVTYPFIRKLMIRKNVRGGTITLKGGNLPQYEVKANKKMKMDPLPYTITVTKKGYQEYKDTIDLSRPTAQKVYYHADLRKIGDTIQRVGGYKSPKFLQRFYDNSGTWFVGVLSFGYSFDFNGGLGFKHQVHLGVLPLRYRMLGINVADFEVTVNDSAFKQTICYRPTLSLYVPTDRGFAFRFYGGGHFNLYDKFGNKDKPAVRTCIIGGVSMRFNYVGRFPMDIFAEYKYPVSGFDNVDIGSKTQLFRVGIIFTGGVDF